MGVGGGRGGGVCAVEGKKCRACLATGVGGGESESRRREENTRDARGDSMATLMLVSE